ncbi:MAG TPA: hypothetical protein VJT71_12660, partial [Pyrinomonadaceae bacterium]|nr:hypothetical protein [Pyrinomonadaceae bacterium]
MCVYNERGIWNLATIDTANGRLERIETPYTDLTFVRAKPGRAFVRAGSREEPLSITELDLQTRKTTVYQRQSNTDIEPAFYSKSEAIEFPTENGLTAHGFYFPPTNRDFAGPADEKPLLLVKSHGGPTSATIASLTLGIQYWTSRGFAVLDVN